jgi:hypothetical protein
MMTVLEIRPPPSSSTGTSLILLPCDDRHRQMAPQVGAAFLTQTLHVEGKTLRLEIWDTAGQEKFQSLSPLYYHGSNVRAPVAWNLCGLPTQAARRCWSLGMQEAV